MSQMNINSPRPLGEGDRSTAAGATSLAVVLAIIVALIILWLAFSGRFSAASGGTTNVNVNPPAQQQPAQKDAPSVNINVPKVEVNPPAQQPAAPSKP
jgi:hypothetical protein